MSDFDIDAAQQVCDRSGPRLPAAWEALDYLPASLAEIRRLRSELQMAYKKGVDTAVNNVQLRSENEKLLAYWNASKDARLQAEATIEQLREIVERIRDLIDPESGMAITSGFAGRHFDERDIRTALGEQVHAAGYNQEDQDNLGQCGR